MVIRNIDCHCFSTITDPGLIIELWDPFYVAITYPSRECDSRIYVTKMSCGIPPFPNLKTQHMLENLKLIISETWTIIAA